MADGVGSDIGPSVQTEPPHDPDAQTTVTDFLDYTDYLPSDLFRSLTLIRNLDERYVAATAAVHELTRIYGQLDKVPQPERPDDVQLRKDISYQLDLALKARECASAEANRLYDGVDRHFNRLSSIITKLKALPKPPSREPTPVPAPVSVSAPTPAPASASASASSEAKRFRSGRRVPEKAYSPTPRITLRLSNPRSSAARAESGEHKHRAIIKAIASGDVIPTKSLVSESLASKQANGQTSVATRLQESLAGTSRRKSGNAERIANEKPPKVNKIKTPKIRMPRLPGMGTNVHSQVAGISTSNALSLLKPPPPDAKPGSIHAPWLRLTEWEMAKLRKRMKKNAVWTPSETMIRRELYDHGRGPEHYRAAKAKAEASGEAFLDEDKVDEKDKAETSLLPGAISVSSVKTNEESSRSNRGMKLNEAKKLKRAALIEAEVAISKLEDIGNSFNKLFGPPAAPATRSKSLDLSELGKTNGKKRKRDSSPHHDGFSAYGVAVGDSDHHRRPKRQRTLSSSHPGISVSAAFPANISLVTPLAALPISAASASAPASVPVSTPVAAPAPISVPISDVTPVSAPAQDIVESATQPTISPIPTPEVTEAPVATTTSEPMLVDNEPTQTVAVEEPSTTVAPAAETATEPTTSELAPVESTPTEPVAAEPPAQAPSSKESTPVPELVEAVQSRAPSETTASVAPPTASSLPEPSSETSKESVSGAEKEATLTVSEEVPPAEKATPEVSERVATRASKRIANASKEATLQASKRATSKAPKDVPPTTSKEEKKAVSESSKEAVSKVSKEATTKTPKKRAEVPKPTRVLRASTVPKSSPPIDTHSTTTTNSFPETRSSSRSGTAPAESRETSTRDHARVRASTVAARTQKPPEAAPTRVSQRIRRPPPKEVPVNEEREKTVDIEKPAKSLRERPPQAKKKSEKKDKKKSKKSESVQEKKQEPEWIDPNEPRYCICGDVSFGIMIQCENAPECKKEWFHLECVGLAEIPPRTAKWYCPECRVKLGIGDNGIVGATNRRR